jgi:pimeloyl-ACP methyl ester carboxylesterase
MFPIMLKAYALTPFGQIHYRLCLPASHANSSPKIPIIFLHKSASSSLSMVNLMNHFASLGYPCYAPDMPGFGGSFDPSPADISRISLYGLKWYSDLYIQVFRDVGVWTEKGVHLLGHHSGAALAPMLAFTAPEIVKSVCLVGAPLCNAHTRLLMGNKFMVPFNTPMPDGSHVSKTWDYLGRMGVTSAGAVPEPPKECSESDLSRWQEEFIDHVRAWAGRMQIYGAVWSCDTEKIFREMRCKVMVLCAKDDVLFEFLGNATGLRPDDESLVVGEVSGANFETLRDAEGIAKIWNPFIESA